MRFFVAAFMSLLSAISFSQTENIWVQKADFGDLKRERAVAFSIGDYGYVGTGEDTNNVSHKDLWRYDPATDTWSQMANLTGVERRNAVAFVIDDIGYVGTGIDSSSSAVGTNLFDFWAYNPSSNSWSSCAAYPGGGGFGVYYAAAFSANGKGYVTCGKIGANWYASDMWEYSPIGNFWTNKAPFPGGVRYGLSALSIDDKGYVGFGIDQDLYRRDWWQYDPISNWWTAKSDLPGSERGTASTFTISQRGFIVLGANGSYIDELWQYNPFTDSWSIKSDFPGAGRRNGIAFSIGNKGYAGIGKGSTGLKRTFYEYTPAGPVGMDENSGLSLEIYPNPVVESAFLFLQNNSDASHYSILNMNGEIVASETITTQSVEIHRNNLPSGTYLLAVTNHGGAILAIEKLIFE